VLRIINNQLAPQSTYTNDQKLTITLTPTKTKPTTKMAISSAITDLFKSAYELVASLVGAVYTIIQSFITGVFGLFTGFISFIGDIFQGLIDVVGGVGRFVAGTYLLQFLVIILY